MWKWLLAVCVAVAVPLAASAQDSLRWETRALDFDDPLLNFSTDIVQGATDETASMNIPVPGSMGSLRIIGTVQDPREWLEVTVVGYALASPAVPETLCRSEIATDGYELHNMRSTSNLTMAEAFATKSNDTQKTTGAFTRCYARGASMLAVHVVFDVSDITTQSDYDARRAAALQVYRRFVDGLVFVNATPANFGGLLLDIPVVLGEAAIDFKAPAIWDVAFNDFTGPLPAEMQLIREADSGATKGLLWMQVIEGGAPADLEVVAGRFVRQYFEALNDGSVTLSMVSNTVDDTLPELAARRVRMSLAEAGDIEASVIWHENRLYIIGLWQNFPPAVDRMSSFARLPGLSSYVMMKDSLVRSLL